MTTQYPQVKSAFGEIGDIGRGFAGLYNTAKNVVDPSRNILGNINPGYDASGRKITQAAPVQQSGGGGDQLDYNSLLTALQGGGAAGGATSDPNLAAQYQDSASQLQGQLGYLDGQQANGQQTINNSYGEAIGGLNQQQAQARRQYDTGVQNNTQNYTSARSGALTQVRSQANALQRLLGLNGAGNSSAAYEQAPYAAALQGSQIINGAQKTYGQNASNLDNSWMTTQENARTAKKKLDSQKAEQETKLKTDIATSRATLLDKIRQANINAQLAKGGSYQQAAAGQQGYQNEVNSLLGQIQGLGKVNPVAFDPSTVQYQTPDMAQYSLEGGSAPQQATTGAEGNVDNTFLSYLTDPRKKDLFGQLAY